MFFSRKNLRRMCLNVCKADPVILEYEKKHYKVDSIVLEFHERHYELDVKKHIVRYRNVINGSRDGGRNFPRGYFQEKKSKIDTNEIDKIVDVFVSFFKKEDFKRKGDSLLLPPGATLDAYISVISGEMELYYTNTHVSGFYDQSTNTYVDGFFVDPVPDVFIILVRLFDGYCEFPKEIPVITPMKYPREVIDHLKQTFKSDDVEVVIGYEYAATDIVEYEFYYDKRKICSVLDTVGFAPLKKITINGYGNTWKSEFENCTIYPGKIRYIHDGIAQTPIARLVYRDIGKYEINESVVVYCDEKRYSFFCDEEIVGQIIPYKGKSNGSDQLIKGDREPYFKAFVGKGINNELKMLIFSFPMLRF